ncbi:translational GTPase TypA [Bacillus fonticola]|uniref:translational GTPase TypA n=1 Tax=Bacillus fonticola TaxID=2728853 RepID=UPI0014761FEC|nr:translational GTPase TypA [Bacillus fonticola]
MNLRNIAIIAHVDHGKTTLVDELLKQSGTFQAHEVVEERAMDSNDIERERGITILAKNTSIRYKDTKINVMDTPGHADFGGEVERIMSMVEGVLLVVDAYEGCMPQTRFVLKKALEQQKSIVVVVNKIDRESARPAEVIDEVLDLLIELGASEDQLEFPIVYTSAINGTSSTDPTTQEATMEPVFEAIIDQIPAPSNDVSSSLQCQISLLDYNDYVGRIGIGRIFRGTISVGQQVAALKRDGSKTSFRVTKLFSFQGLKRVEVKEAYAGDIVAISGIEDLQVGETVCDVNNIEPLPFLTIDEPTLKMKFVVNDSTFAGREGEFVTARKIEERLEKQLQTDVSLRVEKADSDSWYVSGRGELHLSILLENLRREGYELAVSKPEVILREVNGRTEEPFELVHIDIPEEYTGSVMESLGARKGEMLDMQPPASGRVRLSFKVPSRGLIGYTTEFLTITRGYGIYHHTFESYEPMLTGDAGARKQGALVALETGQVTSYSLQQLADRGVMFVAPGTDVYAGMIVGENNRDNDLTVNVTKQKHATNVRSANKDQTVTLKRPKVLSLEEALEFLNEDEMCEITPKSIRLRKKLLNQSERERASKRKQKGVKVLDER